MPFAFYHHWGLPGKSYWKRLLKNLPILHLLYRWYAEAKLKQEHKPGDTEQIFTDIYQKNSWNNGESVSGPGSTVSQTAGIVAQLPVLCDKLGIKSIFDAPCGDLNWMQHVALKHIRYIGGDIVPALIEANKKKYAKDGIALQIIDITKDKLPDVDAILVRDCLVHLSYHDIGLFLQNLKTANINYLITTSFPKTRYNYNIRTGSWRALNLQKKPFLFPKPLYVIVENNAGGYGRFSDKSLMVWEIDKLQVFNN